MADLYSQEEIQEVTEAYFESLRTGTPITKELGKSMLDAKIGIKGASDEIVKGFSQLGRSVTDYGAAMYKGQQGMKAFSQSIDDVGNAIDTFANILIGALAFIHPLAAAGIFLTKTLVKGALDYGKAAGEMSDKLYDAYQGLTRVGGAGQAGMTGVYDSMQKFAYGIDELDKLTALVRENSKELALFSGTVVEGADVLANTAETIQRSGLQKQFLEMGMSVDNINRGIAGYYGQLGRLGQLQGKTQEQLTAGAAAYLTEMEGLTRLTGQQREDMEKQRQEANMIDAFLAQVRQEGDKGQEAYNIFNTLYAASPAIAKQFALQYSGFITQESAQMFQATGGAVGQLTQSFKEGRLTWIDTVKGIGAAYDKTLPFQEGLAMIAGSGRNMFGPLQDAINVAALANKDFGKALEQTKPIDGLTSSAVAARQAQMRTRDSMQDFVRMGVGPATDALAKLADTASAAARNLPGGGNKTAVGGSGSDSGGWLRNLLGLGPAKVSGTTGLDTNLAKAISGALNDYKNLTGNTATINSGVRSYEDQKKLYDAYIAGGKKGMPVAPPGSSQHESGHAVDLNQNVLDYMEKNGILQKYGLVRPVADDPVHVELAGARTGYSRAVNAAPPDGNQIDSAQNQYDQMTGNNNEMVDLARQRLAAQMEANALAKRNNELAEANLKVNKQK
jgi:hypothetical protein